MIFNIFIFKNYQLFVCVCVCVFYLLNIKKKSENSPLTWDSSLFFFYCIRKIGKNLFVAVLFKYYVTKFFKLVIFYGQLIFIHIDKQLKC